jgi:hypothetical protein
MVFVYGTQGTSEENAWSFAKARLDQETWQYRANGSVDVVRDVDVGRARHRAHVAVVGESDLMQITQIHQDSGVLDREAIEAVTAGARRYRDMMFRRPGHDLGDVIAVRRPHGGERPARSADRRKDAPRRRPQWRIRNTDTAR